LPFTTQLAVIVMVSPISAVVVDAVGAVHLGFKAAMMIGRIPSSSSSGAAVTPTVAVVLALLTLLSPL
jgi:hypothetical protein